MQTAFLKARNSLNESRRFAYGAVSKPIADSWNRCLREGLSPLGDPVEAIISHQDLKERRGAHEYLMRLVRPELELLSTQIAGSNYLVAFADNTGVVLDRIMDGDFRNSSCGKSIVPGSIWSENYRGTNALGLSLHTGKSSMVTGQEHFFAGHGNVSCLSTPIYDDHGNIIGLIDASSQVTARQNHTLALVILAASNVENRLFVDSHREEQIIQFHPRREYLTTQSVGMISFNADGQITGVNRRSSELLCGLDLTSAERFSDLFQGAFRPTMGRLSKGEQVLLVDWLHSSFFARIRLTHSKRQRTDRSHSTMLPIETISEIKAIQNTPYSGRIFEDESLRYNLNLACKSAQHGLAVMINGASGTGKNTIAREIHDRCHPDSSFINVDCASLSLDAIEGSFIVQMLSGKGKQADKDRQVDLDAGGTLFLHKLDDLDSQLIASLTTVLNRLLQRSKLHLSKGDWIVLSSVTLKKMKSGRNDNPEGKLRERLAGFQLLLPELNKRYDFHKLARTLMASISPRHTLSKSAIDFLQGLEYHNNFHGLGRKLRTIAVHHNDRVIRADGVSRTLGIAETDIDVCPRCKGQAIKEMRCVEIRKNLRECHGNVALAARRLGVSRNTVYTHGFQ